MSRDNSEILIHLVRRVGLPTDVVMNIRDILTRYHDAATVVNRFIKRMLYDLRRVVDGTLIVSWPRTLAFTRYKKRVRQLRLESQRHVKRQRHTANFEWDGD